MERTRIKLAVYMDLDPVTGSFHSADSARNHMARMLNEMIPWYNPMVSIESYNTRSKQMGDDEVTPDVETTTESTTEETTTTVPEHEEVVEETVTTEVTEKSEGGSEEE